ncbi:MAG TPA: DUF5996 family protein [Aggregatilineaceae bacterium]|nr:DUF5996 family protein [Aggregatilineaceae bacterium]
MSLPALTGWAKTRTGLHQAAQVIGAVRAAVARPEPNWSHLGLRVVPHGLTTGALASVGELVLDFLALTILYSPLDHAPASFSLLRHTQRSLADVVERGLSASGHPVVLKRDKITGEATLDFDPSLAADYARVLYLLAGIFQAFREGLPGEKSPLVVWPHGFDLSFLWFATDVAREEGPHMAFGFSPGSSGLDRPYIYSYVYPLPAGLTDHDLPPLTRWHTEGWTGTVTEYDDLVVADDAAAVVADILHRLYAILTPTLGG